jgi:WD40 repeat protein
LWLTNTGKVLQIYRGHSGYVKAVSFDSGRVMTGGSDATVRLYDLGTAKELRVFRKHTEPVVAVAFASGKVALTGGREATVLPWVLPAGDASPAPRPKGDAPSTTVQQRTARPEAVIPVGGTIGAMLLSPDRKRLFYLDLTGSLVGRVDTKTLKRDEPLPLLEGTSTLAMSRDGKLLVAPWAAPKSGPRSGSLQLIDAESFAKRPAISLSFRPYDVAVGDGEAFVSDAQSDWTSVAAIPLVKGKQRRDVGTVWGRSLLALSRDGKRLFASSQGVVPGTLDALDVTGKSAARSASRDKLSLGGEFVISPDGKFLIHRSGTVLSAEAEDLKSHARIDPHLSAAVDDEGGAAWVIARDGSLRQYSYPDFRPQGRWRLALTAYGVAVDGKAGQLYVAGFDPRSVAERPRAKGHGDVHVYAIKALGKE